MQIYYSKPWEDSQETTAAWIAVSNLINNRFPTLKLSDVPLGNLDHTSEYLEVVRRIQSEIVESDLIIADFTMPSTNVGMEAYFAQHEGIRVLAFTGLKPISPWIRYICDHVATDMLELEDKLHLLMIR